MISLRAIILFIFSEGKLVGFLDGFVEIEDDQQKELTTTNNETGKSVEIELNSFCLTMDKFIICEGLLLI